FVAIPAKTKRTSLFSVGAVVLVFLLLAGGVGGYLLLRPKTSSTNTSATTQGTTTTETPIAKADIIEIPGGTFQMGRNDGPFQERPEHTVTVQTFYMDRTEVTNEEYAQFVRDIHYEPPSHWLRGKPLPLQEKWPVGNVSPRDAEAFAKWRSQRDGVTYRLPTEEEWEYAARNGNKDNLYPWGNTWQSGRAASAGSGVGASQPVGTCARGMSAGGVLDPGGHVWAGPAGQ